MTVFSEASKALLVFLCLACVHAYEISAIETGSVTFEGKWIRLNTCMAKKVQLKLTSEYYDSHKDIEAIVSISGLKMDDQLAFYIYHNLACIKNFCELQINLQRYTPKVNEFFEYEVTIDYLIAQGLNTVNFNMTYHTQHFKIPTFQPEMNLSKWRAILIPNGFSDLKLLGKVQHEIISNLNALKLTYQESSNFNKQVIQSTWTMNKKFILYKIVFLPKSYLQNSQNKEDFTSFIGFKSTKKHQIDSYFYVNNVNNLEQSQSQQQPVSYFSMPVRKTAVYHDNRKIFIPKANLQTTTVQVQKSESNGNRLLIGAIFIVFMQIVYLIYKKKVIEQKKRLNETVVFPDLIVSFDEGTKDLVKKSVLARQTEQNMETGNNIKVFVELKE